MSTVKAWMAAATRVEQEELADLAGTSRAHLYHLSTGRRVASADLARALELASKHLSAVSRERLAVLRREDLCPACGRCEYAKRCSAAGP